MKRKITLCILLILIIMCVTLLSYEKINKTKVNNDNGMFAIFLEEENGSGTYQKSNLKMWPTEEEYTINMLKSYCENGSILRWNNVDKKISLKVNGTDKCYVYFDKAEIGTEKHPHLIQTIEDLVRLSNDVNGGTTYAGEYFLLTNDLDFNDPSDYENPESIEFGNINGINGNEPLIKELTTGSGFVPIGKPSSKFEGIFDGGNKKIDNLYIDSNILKNVGFFGNTNGDVTIKNLTVSGEIKRTLDGEMSGLVARVDGKIYIENCHNEVNANDTSGTNTVAGIIGSLGGGASATIKNSSNKGQIKGGAATGGLVAYSNGNLTIENCINYGKISNNLGQYVGGLLGKDYQETNSTMIINSHNEGKITTTNATSSLVGGLCGKIYGNVTIKDSFNIGDIINDSKTFGSKVGGLIGEARILHIENSYNKGSIENNKNKKFTAINDEPILDYDSSGGLVGRLYSGNIDLHSTIKNSYNLSEGTIAGGMESGGIIGYVYIRSNLSLINVFNNADVEASTDLGKSGCAGGIVGYLANNSKLNVINSYNTGNISILIDGSNAGGIVSYVYISELNMVNVYNNSNVSSVSNASGLLYNIGDNIDKSSKVIFNNGYFYGNVNGQNTNIIATTNNTIQNLYYKNSFTAVPGATTLEEDKMKSQELVDILNKNIESINLEEIDEALKDYTLSKWELGKNGYPTLVNE